MMQQPSIPAAGSNLHSDDDDDDDDDDSPLLCCQHESSSKKRRPASYRPPRTIPPSFTSVTGSFVGTGTTELRRNLSFSRIDPYVSYAQTPRWHDVGQKNSNNNTNNNNSSAGGTDANGGDGMDTMMDASNGEQQQQRVRSMSF